VPVLLHMGLVVDMTLRYSSETQTEERGMGPGMGSVQDKGQAEGERADGEARAAAKCRTALECHRWRAPHVG
jgi:hypothetical protein